MVAIWRICVAIACFLLAIFTSKPLVTTILNAIVAKVGERWRWVVDVKHYMTTYLSWILGLLWLVVAVLVLDLNQQDYMVTTLRYVSAFPIILGTFTLRKVITNAFVRHFRWDRQSADHSARIMVVTEGISFICFIFIVVEAFYIFFNANKLASFLVCALFVNLEILLVFASFTLLKNIATGLFLIFAEPFRIGSFCTIRSLTGSIEEVSLAFTSMRRQDGSLVLLPNGFFGDHAQLNENLGEKGRFESLIQCHPTTPFNKLKLLVHELSLCLQHFAVEVDDAHDDSMRSTFRESDTSRRATNENESCNGSVGNQGYRSTSIRSLSPCSSALRSFTPVSSPRSPVATLLSDKACQVFFRSMYTIEVVLQIDREKFESVDAARSEINLAILGCLQDLHIQIQDS